VTFVQEKFETKATSGSFRDVVHELFLGVSYLRNVMSHA